MGESKARSLYLVHRGLNSLPPRPVLSAGYRLRTWQDGDETKVPPVLGDAFFRDPGVAAYETFRRFLEERGGFIPGNIFVVEAASGEAVGTTTARFMSAWVGRLHRVGVRSEHQGRGLGKALVHRALRHLAESGVETAYVGTEDTQLAAIAVYLWAGFQPVLDRATYVEQGPTRPPDNLEQTWKAVYAGLEEFRSTG